MLHGTLQTAFGYGADMAVTPYSAKYFRKENAKMARIPQVTRTITTTKANALCVDTVSMETLQKELVLPRTYKDDKALLKAAEKALNSDTLKVVAVLSHEEVETLYGMSEQDFIAFATVLPPRA